MIRKYGIRNHGMKALMIGLGLLTVAALQGCSHSKAVEVHNKVGRQVRHSVHGKLSEIFFGKTDVVVWGHQISLTPCRNAAMQTLSDNSPLDSHHVIQCGATKVQVVNEELRVNEKSYGKLQKEASVRVADGKVAINGSEVQPVAQVAQK